MVPIQNFGTYCFRWYLRFSRVPGLHAAISPRRILTLQATCVLFQYTATRSMFLAVFFGCAMILGAIREGKKFILHNLKAVYVALTEVCYTYLFLPPIRPIA